MSIKPEQINSFLLKVRRLTSLFGVSEFVVKTVIDGLLPVLVEFFNSSILERADSDKCSILSERVRFVMDSTITPVRRPRKQQERAYNGHYKCHGKLVHLLVDLDGNIASMACNVDGRCHDALYGTYNDSFREVCAKSKSLSLGDSGFQGVSYCVAGYKPVHIKTDQQRVFDTITRKEQVVVEHVNCFIKKCKSLTKEGRFIHSPETLAGIAIVVCGWYNWRKRCGFVNK